MNCPSCGAPMHPHGDTLVCDFCHNVVVPDTNDDGVSVLEEAPGQSCPICINLPLMQATLAKLPLLYCTKCRGMLVSMEEFQTLIDALRATQRGSIIQPPMDPGDLNRRINCPKCHRPMEAHSYCGPGNVVIDSCEPCSLNWLDHGELARIAQAPDDRGPDPDYRDPDSDYRDPASDYDSRPLNRNAALGLAADVVDAALDVAVLSNKLRF